MNSGRITAIAVLLFAIAGTAFAATETAIADAAEVENGAAIRVLLFVGANVNASQVDGTTALHWAAYHDDTDAAQLLVESGADVSAENDYGVAPLFLACTNGNAPLVRLLLGAGASANASLPGGETVLMTAARTGNIEAVEALLAAGADPNARERNQQTALMWAAAEGHAPVVQALIGAGSDFRATLKSGFTPLFFAVREGHIDVTHTLIEAGVGVSTPFYHEDPEAYKLAKNGTSPLLLAIENGHFELAFALLKSGADPNDERTGFTPLHTMTWVRKPDVSDLGDPSPEGSGNLSSLQFVRVLVEMGANVNARLEKGKTRPPKVNARGATPFLMAADRADAPLMRVLLELGADPFLPNAENTTPLMAAAGLGTTAPIEEAGTEAEAFEATQLMLELGADINAIDDNGETVMHGAAYGSFPKIVQLLVDNNAEAEIWKQKNNHGWTPLFIAEGFRPGNFKPGPATIKALHRVMAVEGISTDGARPQHVDHYQKPSKKPEEKNQHCRPLTTQPPLDYEPSWGYFRYS